MSPESVIKLDKFKPRSYQMPMCLAFEKEKYRKILAVWPRRCLCGDALIAMADGSYKYIESIEEGDFVLAWNGNQFVRDMVVDKWRTEPKTVHELSSDKGLSLFGSGDHKFATGDFEFKKLSEISEDDNVWVYDPIVQGHVSKIPVKTKKLNYEECMYDMQTQNHHNFIANGYVVHNSGKDIVAWNLLVREALRNVGNYYYCLPTFRQARLVIWESITNSGQRFKDFIPEQLIENENNTEMVLRLVNGSSIRLIGSDNYDNSLIGTNPKMVVFSEYALSDSRAYTLGARPILNANKGKVIIISCVVGNTLVLMKDGFKRIEKVSKDRSEYSDLNKPVYGLGGFHKATDFYYGGKVPTLKIKTDSGYEIECSHIHKLHDGNDWVKATDLKEGSRLSIQYNQQIFKEDEAPRDYAFYYLMGFRFSGTHITESIFNVSKRAFLSFIAGLVEGRALFNEVYKGAYEITIPCKNTMASKYLQVLLLNAGIVTYRTEVTFNNMLTVKPQDIPALFAKIGQYMLNDKKKDDISKMCSAFNVKDEIGEKYTKATVTKIEKSESEVFDFVIPETHSFFSNGFISHNTPRGRNSLFELYNIAKDSKDWFCEKLSLSDTQHISAEEIQAEIESGEISADLAAQEYYSSFNLGIEGSYYSKYIDKLRFNGQISTVPYDPQFLVHTTWDLGLSDKTVIIFFQMAGQIIRIIDYMEGTDRGLEYYIRELHTKDYVYGKHIAPHDIKVREWASGATRLQKAKQLGINFTVAPRISIEDGIEGVRSMFSRLWIDENNCKPLIKALESYRREYDVRNRVYKNRPLHDFSSDACDAMRMLAISLHKLRDNSNPQDLEKRYHEAINSMDNY